VGFPKNDQSSRAANFPRRALPEAPCHIEKMAKNLKLSRKKLLERAQQRAAAERERFRLIQKEIAKKQQLLRSAKAEECDDRS
jgi:hypothetical protein